jgi:hypothetical protein
MLSGVELWHRCLQWLTGQISHNIRNNELLHRFMGINRAAANETGATTQVADQQWEAQAGARMVDKTSIPCT